MNAVTHDHDLAHDAAHAAGLDFDAALTREQVEQIEREWPQSHAQQRRVALALMTKAKADLIGDPTPDTLDALLAMTEHIQEWREQLARMVELADSAHARATAAALTILHARPEWADSIGQDSSGDERGTLQ